MTELPRRTIIYRLLALAAAVPVAHAADSCGKADANALRGSLHYADASTDAAKTCSGCAFYTAQKDPCGYCMILDGPVSASGHCDSWNKKEE